MAASLEDLAAVEGIGGVIAASVADFLALPANQGVLDKLRAAGVSFREPGVPAGGLRATASGQGPEGEARAASGSGQAAAGVLAGKSVVVTGTVEGYTREEAEAAIVERGGKSPGSVSARTFALVLGSDPGAAKLKKAEELGIPVIEGDSFEQLLETGELPAS